MLPFIKSDDRVIDQLQTKWLSELNPLLAQPLSSANLLTGVVLTNGVTVINHKLGRQMQGWIVSDTNAPATIYRSAPMNTQTLTLTSNAACTVNLVVF